LVSTEVPKLLEIHPEDEPQTIILLIEHHSKKEQNNRLRTVATALENSLAKDSPQNTRVLFAKNKNTLLSIAHQFSSEKTPCILILQSNRMPDKFEVAKRIFIQDVL